MTYNGWCEMKQIKPNLTEPVHFLLIYTYFV